MRHLTAGPALGLATALALSLSACGGGSNDDEVTLLADTIAGQSLTVLEEHGTPTIWVSSESGADPRPGGKGNPSVCTVSGTGSPRLAAPAEGNAKLGDTTLYAVAQVEGLQPPAEITCSGAGFKHVYVGTN